MDVVYEYSMNRTSIRYEMDNAQLMTIGQMIAEWETISLVRFNVQIVKGHGSCGF